MHDLTQGPVSRHIIKMAMPIGIGMLFQTLYFLVDLYFVARIGDAAIAGVGAAGNIMFIVMALTQVLGVGTVTLIAQAVGRKDHGDANLVFNQSLLLAALCGVLTLVLGYLTIGPYMRTLGADAATQDAGIAYLAWYLPGLALQFAAVSMGSALRGTGIAKPTMLVQVLTVVINAILAPVLIAGWGTGSALGIAGAGLATTISIAVGVVLLALYFIRLEKFVAFERKLWAPRVETWRRILGIGLPAGGEFALMFIYMAVIYTVIRDFGATAQAGFGIGARVMQAIFLPAMAVAFATSPVAGQNMGAGLSDRVRATFRSAIGIGSVLMLALTLICQVEPGWFVRAFTSDAAVVAIATQFLRYISWNFVAQGIVFTCSGMFQALGNTVPSLVSSASRLLTFALPTIWLSHQPGFELRHVWMASVASVTLQAIFSLWLMRREFQLRLKPAAVATAAA
ncbi:MATE family efflux transporter [Rudaea cellulosilytica]|uniref:MATE family efflux transporter n=1 Tax=Rudaea cellulosilytica TaxID=540746 RepID=UPI000371EEE6|nr:MATE family efflux transporter [Rudaea cellulosilytica]